MLICKFLKGYINEGHIPNSVIYWPLKSFFKFSSSLSPSDECSLVPHSFPEVFMWFHYTLIFSLPSTPIFTKHAKFSCRNDFPFAFDLTIFHLVSSPPHSIMLPWPSLSMYFHRLACYCLRCLDYIFLFSSSSCFNFHSCILATSLAAAASEGLYHVDNFEMFLFTYWFKKEKGKEKQKTK